jgi:two-component system LytT family response regulator
MKKFETDHSQISKCVLNYKTHDGHIQIDVDTIICCRGDGGGPYTHILMDGGKIHCACVSLGFIEDLLNECHFLRCHKSWLVNLKKVQYFSSREKIMVINNNTTVPISKSKWPETLKKLIDFTVQDRKYYAIG